MKMAVEIFVLGGILPAAVSIAVFLLARLVLADKARERYPAAIGLAVGLVVGYILLPDWADLWPTREWQWLPYLVVIAAVLGPVTLASGVYSVERWLVYLLFAVVAGLLLVPNWVTLEPYRAAYVAGFAGALVLYVVLLDALPERVSPPLVLLSLTITTLVATVAVADQISLKIGQVMGIATACMGGCFVGALRHREGKIARGVVLAIGVVMIGSVLRGYLGREPRLTAMLSIPIAPLALWLFAWGPLSRLTGKKAIAVQVALVLVVLAAAMIWLYVL